MKKILYLLITIIACSCGSSNLIEKEGTSFYYTENVKKELADSIANYFVGKRESLEKLRLNQVESVRIDSANYSYLLYFSCANIDSVVQENDFNAWYGAFAKFLSEDVLDSAAVHVFLTDGSFNIKKGIPFNQKAYRVIEQFSTSVIGKTKMKYTGDFINNFALGLHDELINNKPELFKGKDSLEIEATKGEDKVEVAIFIDPKTVNMERVNSQFEKSDPILYDILFSYHPTYFNLVDRNTKENLKVFIHRYKK